MKFSNAVSTYTRLLVITLLLAAPTASQAAYDLFLQLGDIKGESVDAMYPDWIDVLSISEGMSQSGTTHLGGGGGEGKVNVSDISITKYLDSSSPYIRQHVANGKNLDGATIVLRKADGDTKLEVFKIELTNVLVTSVSMGVSDSSDQPTESITLNFAEIKWTYTPQDDKGTAGGPIEASWNIVTGTPQ